MSKTKTRDVVEQIRASIAPTRSLRWDARVAPEHAQTLAEIRAAYHAGSFGAKKKPACMAIARWLNEQGISTVGHQGVREWLEKQ